MWVNLDQLECLQAISEAGSISGAAEKLNKAKSAIHYSIKKLEEQVDFRVVDTRSYRGCLTKKGEQFLSKAQKVLEVSQQLEMDAHQIATGVELRLRVSATEVFDIKKLHRSIRSLQKEFPDTEVVFHREILSGEKMLRRNLVDVAIFEHLRYGEEYDYKQIDEVKLYLVISNQHPFLKLKQSEQIKERLFNYPQVIQRSTIPDDDLQGVYLNSRQWTVSDLASKKEIILEGLGWGRLPSHQVIEDIEKGKLVCLDRIEKPLTIPVYIGRKKDIEPGKAIEHLWDSFNHNS